MNLGYDAETDALYIAVSEGISAECLEICDGVILDFDSNGSLVGIDIHRVSSLPQELEIPDRLPAAVEALGASTSSDD